MESPKKLFNKNYYLLWQGQTVSRIGNQVFSVAMILWLIDFTDKASLLGLMGMLAGIPEVLFSPIGGTFADRFSRRTIIILCDFINGLLMVTLASIFYFYSHSVNVIIIALLIITPLSALVNSFFYPAISAAIPDLVPRDRLNSANSLSQSTAQIISILGQMLGSSLYFLLGTPVLIFLNGYSFIFSSFCELFMHIPQKISYEKHTTSEHLSIFRKDLLKGLQYVWKKKGLKNMVLVSACLSFFTVPVILLFPYYLEKILLINKAWFPYFLALLVAGNLLGFLLASLKITSAQLRKKLVIAFILMDSTVYGILGFVSHLYIAIALIVFSGLMGGFVQVYIQSIMQMTTPSEIRGRVFGFLGTLGASLSPLAMGLGGIIADLTNKNIPLIYSLCSLCMIVFAVITLSNKDIREFLAYTSDSVPLDNITEDNTTLEKKEILTNP